ncbi:ABC transporter ATP-binding protein [Candidatus Methylomirabilis sp.]|uniref:ABC transporter ATP-binding protein n=1 Tax=Candidatus Methylomirabilis sp. TaxID=2032687 RepID=UPI002A6655FC|nr:ABC transporter ATP-binding protein [Candidatus Methylomirabilis sp.]
MPVLQVEDLSIRLLLHRERTGSIREHVIRMLKGRAVERDEFWPLREVSFTLYPGETFGIIGANGAGKSTLLKVIAGIIPPSIGSVIARGRIAPLIELGAGFDPFLTGRENIFLYGSLLGFSQKELEKRFDRIVGFAELEEFIDVPLMNYSVGMSARLGFAIATDVEPDLLLIDELFSVGDAVFQKKCEERMETFKAKRVTILLVSHDLKLIRDTCHRTLCLHHGQVVALGPTEEVVAEYKRFSALTSPSQQSDGNAR